MSFGTTLLLLVTIVVILRMFYSHARRKSLFEKYQDEKLVARILRREIWTGQTADQLRDSLGTPLEVDERILKTKIKRIWKYRRTGKGRYALRITLDNDLVTGWDKRR